jgi:hypothetical protein
MKTKNYITAFLLILGIFCAESQTTEQQKMIEKAKRMQDSMMNLPQFKAMMQQIEELNSKQKTEAKKQKSTENKTTQKKTTRDDWFWKNDMYITTVSKNNKLPNWEGGAAEISLLHRNSETNYLKVGTIQADGSITFNFPKDVEASKKTPAFYNPIQDLRDWSSFKFSNTDVGFISRTGLTILRNGQVLGALTIGNSVKVTHNLIDIGSLDSGDEGYLLYWAYADDNFSLNANEDWQGKIQRNGSYPLDVKTNVNYNLNFKKGWNLVKIEVIGNYKLKHERGYEVTWFKNHKHTIVATMPSDARYYFRAIPQY